MMMMMLGLQLELFGIAVALVGCTFVISRQLESIREAIEKQTALLKESSEDE